MISTRSHPGRVPVVGGFAWVISIADVVAQFLNTFGGTQWMTLVTAAIGIARLRPLTFAIALAFPQVCT